MLHNDGLCHSAALKNCAVFGGDDAQSIYCRERQVRTKYKKY